MDNFADGYSKACVSTLMKIVLKAYDGDAEAKRRLEIDLFIEDYDLSDDLKVIHM